MSILINLVFIITGCIGIITTIIIGLKYKTNVMVNKYLIIVYGISGLRFLLQGVSSFMANYSLTSTFSVSHVVILIIMPCVYLYFKDLVNGEEKGYKNLVHLIAPGLLFLLHILRMYQGEIFNLEINLFFFTLLFITFLFYTYLGYRLLKNQAWKWKTDITINSKKNKLVRNWTLFLFIGVVIILIKGGVTIYFNDFSLGGSLNFLFISSIIWLIFFVVTLATPEILYGYGLTPQKIERIKKSEIALQSVWQLDNDPVIVNPKDIKTREKVINNMEDYIIEIEALSLSSDTFRTPGLTQEDLAKKINIPSSHLSYLFKYHSSISFSDYKKTVQIKDAINLIKSDYLQTNTMDSLAREIGFSSYTPFYNSFKNITGLAPHEYYRYFAVSTETDTQNPVTYSA